MRNLCGSEKISDSVTNLGARDELFELMTNLRVRDDISDSDDLWGL